MVELKGSLSGIGLPAIVQLISELQHSGTLQLSRDDLTSRGTFVFDAGRLVDAACGEAHGLQAVASCAMELATGEFVFVEGPPPSDRTLDLGPDDLQKLLTAVASGDFNQHANGATEVTQVDVALACPLLGFADDPTRHYARATALIGASPAARRVWSRPASSASCACQDTSARVPASATSRKRRTSPRPMRL